MNIIFLTNSVTENGNIVREYVFKNESETYPESGKNDCESECESYFENKTE